MHTLFLKEHCPTILYVEDDDTTRNTAVMLLKKKYPNLIFLTAVNGKDGLEKFRESRPDIVITDILMPVMDGIQMAREIKAMDSDVRIIVTSAGNDADNVVEAIDIDRSDYLCKPIEVRKLFEVIDGWIPPPCGQARSEVSSVRC
ncbi:MAG TPA: response regulator [Geobacteraceae bacterium]|nr:response regulator [Geobacteraceae bacterium]